MNPIYDTHEYEKKRQALVADTNSQNIKPLSFETYKLSNQDKVEQKTAIAAYKSLKENPIRYKETRDEVISALIDSNIPRWGSVKLTLIKP